MKIKFPIDNDRDYDCILAIMFPDMFVIEYADPEARELYYSLTEADKEEIKAYVESYKEP